MNAVTFKVRLFDSFLALGCKALNRLFSLLIERNLLLLVFQKGDEMVVFLGSRVKLSGDVSELVSDLLEFIFGPLKFLPRIFFLHRELSDLLRQQVNLLGLFA